MSGGYKWSTELGDNKCETCGGVRLLGSGHNPDCPYRLAEDGPRLGENRALLDPEVERIIDRALLTARAHVDVPCTFMGETITDAEDKCVRRWMDQLTKRQCEVVLKELLDVAERLDSLRAASCDSGQFPLEDDVPGAGDVMNRARALLGLPRWA